MFRYFVLDFTLNFNLNKIIQSINIDNDEFNSNWKIS